MSSLIENSTTQVLPEWVSMDIEKLGKSFYSSEEQPLNEHIRSLKEKALINALKKRSEFSKNVKNPQLSTDPTLPTDPQLHTPQTHPPAGSSPSYDTIFAEYSRTTDGLVNSALRSQIWPILLGIDDDSSTADTSKLTSTATSYFLDDLDSTDLPPHKDEYQVQLDIKRSFTVLNHFQSLGSHPQNESYTTIFSRSDIDELKRKLHHLIIKILRRHPNFNYYQGFHDIASIVLLVCHVASPGLSSGINVNEVLAFRILDRLTVYHLRDFMISDINLSVNHLRLIPVLLQETSPQLFELIRSASNSYILSDGLHYDYSFLQGLSSILTLFSHDVSNISHILVLWDFIFSYNSVLVSVYIYVASLEVFKDSIFTELGIDTSVEISTISVDNDLLHTLISPASLFGGLTDQTLIKILNRTRTLIETYSTIDFPADTYDKWFDTFNKHSVLLTTSRLHSDPTVTYDEAADFIETQDHEMAQQASYELEIQAKIMQQQEESDYDESSMESSLSLGSAASSFNNKLMNTSSLILKKFFQGEPNEDEDKKRNSSQLNLYKISFTIGFVGFLLHFLIARNSSSHMVRYIPCIPDSITIGTHDTLQALRDVFTHVRNSEFVSSGINVGQIGLGNLRSSIFGFPN